MLSHHRLVHEFVREHVFARRIVDHDRRVAHDRRQILEGDRGHFLSAADSDRAEVALPVAADDAVDVLTAVGGGLRIL